MEYYIPLEMEPGRFVIAPQESDEAAPAGNFLRMERTEYGMIKYRHPVYDRAIRIYGVPEDAEIAAVYGTDGKLAEVTFTAGGQETLLFIAQPDLSAFINEEIIALTSRILEKPGETARLFFENFYDGEAVDFAAKPVSPADMEKVRIAYGADAVNRSGNYPSALRMACDTTKFLVLLSCLPESGEAFYDACRAMKDGITEQVVPKLNKTPDFQVIQEEYD